MPLFRAYFLIFVVFLVSCGGQDKSSFQYQEGLFSYMKEELKLEPETIEDNLFYFLPLESCTPCVEGNLQALESLPKNDALFPVFIFSEKDISQNGYAVRCKSVCNKFSCVYDSETDYMMYKNGIVKPLLIHIKKGGIIYAQEISDFEIEKAKKYVLSILE
jgi:hypothetical protein